MEQTKAQTVAQIVDEAIARNQDFTPKRNHMGIRYYEASYDLAGDVVIVKMMVTFGWDLKIITSDVNAQRSTNHAYDLEMFEGMTVEQVSTMIQLVTDTACR